MPYRASDYDPNFTGPVNPGADLEESQLARLLGLDMPEMDTRQETVQQPSRLGQFFEGFSGLEESPALARPTTFAQGLVSGVGRGLGGAGTRARLERDKLEQAGRVRQATRDERNFEATRRYRESRAKGLQDTGKESRAAASKQADFERDNPTVAQLQQNPALARMTEGMTPDYRPPSGFTTEALKRTLPESVSEKRAREGTDRANNAADRANRLATVTSTNALVDDYRLDPAIKGYQNVHTNLNTAESAAKERSGPGDIALVFSFMRALEPENPNAVREGEYANARQATGLLNRVKSLPARYFQGDQLTEIGREFFLKSMRSQLLSRKPDFDVANDQYRRRSSAFGVDPTLFIREFNAPASVANPAEARTTAPVATNGRPDPASFWRP